MDVIDKLLKKYVSRKINKGWRPGLKDRLTQSRRDLENIESRLVERVKEIQEHVERADLLEHILDHSSILVSAFDLDGNYIYANDRHASIYNKGNGDLIGMNIREVLDEEKWEVVKENHTRASSGEIIVTKYRLDFNGVDMNFDTQYYPYYNGGVVQKGYIVISSMMLAE